MKVITGPRQSGKTTEAIRLANENDAYLAVHTHERAADLYHSDNHPDLDKFPITHDYLRNGFRGIQPHNVVIDDLDMFLRSAIDVPIDGVALTSDEATVLTADYRDDRFDDE